MDIVEEVRGRGGVVRSEDLRRSGASKEQIAAAVRLGMLIRPRRGWIAAADADPLLVSAARAGVILTCVTRTARLGLWDPGADGHHVAAKPNQTAVDVARERTHVHWAEPLVARIPGELEDPVENALGYVAECLAPEDALAVWESAAREGLIEISVMRRFRLRPRAREIAARATGYSDAGTESIVMYRLKWMPVRIMQQVHIAGRRVDFLIGERLVLQIDGGHHVGPQRDADNAHDVQLRLQGYHVIRVSYRQIMEQWPWVQDQVSRAVAQGLHLAA
ncbi:type IV toxin-antitoxin system AbiEi family antitoxin domain-containing protein [Microbacterium indicum]|uniref:type IV toxin-antitoxin system AbiEi family antitoxin domain-containing protein n=1 Tax=Microbacterium indicum TaxID=358100 RepID=UPI0003FF2D1F|nr:type IV toxin-antitoxin system AbiEi family antitoxin domain-containing protein [Microbacterium indicum]